MASHRPVHATRWLVPATSAGALLSALLVAACSHGDMAAARAAMTDGRLLGDTTSDVHGVFRLTVPARETVRLALDAGDGT